ncbi:MAG: hypothetical protein V4813_00530 [Gemmatimonadota bacterium]
MTRPIACTLDDTAAATRARTIAALNTDGLRAVERSGRMLMLTYTPAMRARVDALVLLERECCAFLHFTVEARAGATRLAIFAPFLVGAPGEPVGATGTPTCAVDCACSTATRDTGSDGESPESRHGADSADDSGADGRGWAGRLPGTAAGSAAAVALACGVCCVVPLALPAIALTSVGGALAVFAGAYRWMTYAAVALTLAGWLYVAGQSVRKGQRPSRATWRSMMVATLFVGLAMSWPRIERDLRPRVAHDDVQAGEPTASRAPVESR